MNPLITDDECGRESDQPHTTRETEREAVDRWADGGTLVAAGVLEAVKGFRRLKGHKAMPQLVATLRALDQQLGLAVKVETVA